VINIEEKIPVGPQCVKHRKLTDTIKYRMNGRCSNNQAEQLAILKALETYNTWTQRITLETLKNRKNHTHLLEQIRTKVIQLVNQNWIIDCHWVRCTQGITATSWRTNWRRRLRLARKTRAIRKYRKAQRAGN
jgi:ribonuclease HI